MTFSNKEQRLREEQALDTEALAVLEVSKDKENNRQKIEGKNRAFITVANCCPLPPTTSKRKIGVQ